MPTAYPAGALGQCQGFSTKESLVPATFAGSLRGAGGVPPRDGAVRSEARNPALHGLIALLNAERLGHDLERSRAKQVLRARIVTVSPLMRTQACIGSSAAGVVTAFSARRRSSVRHVAKAPSSAASWANCSSLIRFRLTDDRNVLVAVAPPGTVRIIGSASFRTSQ